MNILTFDIEEWYTEKAFHGGRVERYQLFDKTLDNVMEELNRLNIKATFFCVGKLATDFPKIVRKIAEQGHEVGCHSNVHTWLNKLNEETLQRDTMDAIKALEDVSGQKVISYRAPAFSITPSNKWAVNVLASCGIENDASIFPANRHLGGYSNFPQDTPCIICHEGATLKEYPISLTTLMGRRMVYSGGGYFRMLPYWYISRTINKRDYTICYFHLNDLIKEKKKMRSKAEYEEYFKEPGTIKNRILRYVKGNVGTGNAWGKLCRLIEEHPFLSMTEANQKIDWGNVCVVNL